MHPLRGWKWPRTLGLVALLALTACGGGGSDGGGGSAPAPAKRQLVGEIFSEPAQIATAEIQSTAGYAGNVATSRAIQAAGKAVLLDLMLQYAPPGPQGRPLAALLPDARERLAQYATANADLLQPGARVLVLDEVFFGALDPSDTVAALEPQFQALQTAIANVRSLLPRVSVGITVTPYSTFGRPNTLAYIRRVLPLVDWVGTDPYWFGDPAVPAALHTWSQTFHDTARSAHPPIETWFIAQAFKPASLDIHAFNGFITEQLGHADRYDHVLLFGWQFASELDPGTRGQLFPAATKQLYRKYLKPGL